ncbi:MbcA/ParS/Xre antitoxin family protein [Cupriavidus pauculus]|uniref:MbcA/ParS/Xre antitoxin family protein n=1 Tax=Cupriavidus pauculus TaxID=82633 RepID=UPI001EE39DAA|nr:MbcA/ParS/Xre antitoxin family protein [Cupriavidus pauculus]GJG97776.1 hypothetical protein CBA19C6_24825 [Cupriavidus pauculus]
MWLDHLVRGGKSRRKPVFSFLETGMAGEEGRTLRTRVYVDGYNLYRENTNVVVGLVIPTCDHKRNPNADLTKYSHWTRSHITEQELAAAQLPRAVPKKRGMSLKPVSWYPRPDLLGPALELAIRVRRSSSEAFKWLSAPNEHLSGEIPLTLLESDAGAARVMAYIDRWIAEHSTRPHRAPDRKAEGKRLGTLQSAITQRVAPWWEKLAAGFLCCWLRKWFHRDQFQRVGAIRERFGGAPSFGFQEHC